MRLGVCYFPEHWPSEEWERDVAAMADAGLEYVRMAEFSWGVLEPERGTFDFEWLDEAIEAHRRPRHAGGVVHADGDAAEVAGRRAAVDPQRRPRRNRPRTRQPPALLFQLRRLPRGTQLGSSSGSPSDTPTRRTSPAGRRTTSSAVTRPSGTATIVPTRSERGSRTGTVILTDSTRRGERVLEPAVRLLRRNRSAWADPCRASPLAAAGVRTLFQRFRRRVQSPPRRPDTRG